MVNEMGNLWFQCPVCGQFLGKEHCHYNPETFEISKVHGTCKTHGEQDVTEQGYDWEWFFPEDTYEKLLDLREES